MSYFSQRLEPLIPLQLTRLDAEKPHDEAAAGPLVFQHIPKTAGTSLSMLLAELFGDCYFSARSDRMFEAEGKDPADYKIIAGHFSKSFAYAFPKRNSFTVFRNPIDRTVSQYLNWRDDARIQWNDPAWVMKDDVLQALQIARSTDVIGFVKTEHPWIADNIRNTFTRALCDDDASDPYTSDERLVESAFDNIRRFFWLGIQEDFQRSLLMLSRQLNVYDTSANSLVWHNTAGVKVGLSPGERNDLAQVCQLDLKLFSLVRDEFERRFSSLASFSIRREIDYREKLLQSDRSEWLSFDFEEIEFLGGWRYQEADPAGQKYRWSLRGAVAAVRLHAKQSRARSVIVRLRILSVAPEFDLQKLNVSLEGLPASKSRALQGATGQEVVCSFDGLAGGSARQFLIEIEYPESSGTLTLSEADASALGIALTAIDIVQLT